MISAGLAAGVLGAPIIGAWLHELTHAAAAVGLGGRVRRIDLVHLEVIYELDDQLAEWRDRAINLAPLAVGTIAGIMYVATVGTPTGLTSAPLVLGWAVFTLLGGVEDYSYDAAHSEWERERWWQIAPWEEMRPATQVALLLLVGELVALATLAMPLNAWVSWEFYAYFNQVVWGLWFGAVGYCLIQLTDFEGVEEWDRAVASA